MSASGDNPLLRDWDAPHGLPPFDQIHPEHFAPAFEQAMREHLAQIDAIAGQADVPGFENTVARFDACGQRFTRSAALFHNLCASHTSPALQAVQRELARPLAAHANAVHLHRGFFERLEAVYRARERPGRTEERFPSGGGGSVIGSRRRRMHDSRRRRIPRKASPPRRNRSPRRARTGRGASTPRRSRNRGRRESVPP